MRHLRHLPSKNVYDTCYLRVEVRVVVCLPVTEEYDNRVKNTIRGAHAPPRPEWPGEANGPEKHSLRSYADTRARAPTKRILSRTTFDEKPPSATHFPAGRILEVGNPRQQPSSPWGDSQIFSLMADGRMPSLRLEERRYNNSITYRRIVLRIIILITSVRVALRDIRESGCHSITTSRPF